MSAKEFDELENRVKVLEKIILLITSSTPEPEYMTQVDLASLRQLIMTIRVSK